MVIYWVYSSKTFDIGDEVRMKLFYMNHPKDCSHQKYLICEMDNGCGFGCQIHKLTTCLLLSYEMNRILIIDSRNWTKYHENNNEEYCKRHLENGKRIDDSYTCFFQPLSNCTLSKEIVDNSPFYTEENEQRNEKIMKIKSIVGAITFEIPGKPQLDRYWIPKDIKTILDKIGMENQRNWFLGKLIEYLLRPNSYILSEKSIIERIFSFDFNETVGLHVRRNDFKIYKNSHEDHVYLAKIKNYYESEHRYKMKRKVFLMTDATKYEINQLKNLFKKNQITIITTNKYDNDTNLFSTIGLKKLIIDMLLMSKCEYYFGDHLSNIFRLIYELNQEKKHQFIDIQNQYFETMYAGDGACHPWANSYKMYSCSQTRINYNKVNNQITTNLKCNGISGDNRTSCGNDVCIEHNKCSTYNCNGLKAGDPNVCGGYGICLEEDYCLCDNFSYKFYCSNFCKNGRTIFKDVYQREYCKCFDRYYGINCDKNDTNIISKNYTCFGESEFDPKVCGGIGICTNDDVCACKDYGAKLGCTSQCVNGKLLNYNNVIYCSCNSGFYGSKCDRYDPKYLNVIIPSLNSTGFIRGYRIPIEYIPPLPNNTVPTPNITYLNITLPKNITSMSLQNILLASIIPSVSVIIVSLCILSFCSIVITRLIYKKRKSKEIEMKETKSNPYFEDHPPDHPILNNSKDDHLEQHLDH